MFLIFRKLTFSSSAVLFSLIQSFFFRRKSVKSFVHCLKEIYYICTCYKKNGVMKRILITWICIFGVFISVKAQSIIVTDTAEISLITCSPGPAAYEKFGHTALRYYDPSTGVDLVFNYGIFDFDQPDFYTNFIRGETYYMLGVYKTSNFLPQYAERNSQVTEQVLNLSREEKQQLLDALFVNYLPQNRNYLYNFVFDNCATRPRDKVLELFRGKYIHYNLSKDNRTFREWVASYTGEKSWLMFGIDLVFGADADRIASKWETMFLPEVLSKEMSEVVIVDNDTLARNLIKDERIIISRKEEVETVNYLKMPLLATSLVLLAGLLLTLFEYRMKKYFTLVDSLLYIIAGFAGIILFYLMFFSIHPLVKSNINLLWCNPLSILLGILIWFRKALKIVNVWQIVNIVFFLIVLFVGAMGIQTINTAFIPLILLLLIRAFWWLHFKRKLSFMSGRNYNSR